MSNFKENEFEEFESKVENVMKVLENMNSSEETIRNKGLQEAHRIIGNDGDIDETNFIVKVRENRTVINKIENSYENAQQMDKFTFMQQIEKDADQRAEVRKEREKMAQNFRKLGNEAFRVQEFEKAVNMYTKAIDYIKDSTILYSNRALSYIKLRCFKRAIIDCDYVISKIDEKNLQAWLYRAIAYKHLGDESNFDTSVKVAKKNNSKEIENIEKLLNELNIVK